MSDVLICTLALLSGVVACLARPCRPEQWGLVKHARAELTPLVLSESEPPPFLHDASSEPGFADGLETATA